MNNLSRNKKFEEAGKIRDEICNLQQVMSHAHIISSPTPDVGRTYPTSGVGETLAKILGIKTSIKRIECYDVSNIQGKFATGSMVVFTDGKPDKKEYKKFKITTKDTPDDIAMLKETLKRRFAHPEWQYPRVIVVDGSTAQMNAAKKVLSKAGMTIPLVGVVKNERHRPERLIGNLNAIQSFERDILLANSEAHRFAIGWHRKRRQATSIV